MLARECSSFKRVKSQGDCAFPQLIQFESNYKLHYNASFQVKETLRKRFDL